LNQDNVSAGRELRPRFLLELGIQADDRRQDPFDDVAEGGEFPRYLWRLRRRGLPADERGKAPTPEKTASQQTERGYAKSFHGESPGGTIESSSS
jgi:hypothetical protein